MVAVLKTAFPNSFSYTKIVAFLLKKNSPKFIASFGLDNG